MESAHENLNTVASTACTRLWLEPIGSGSGPGRVGSGSGPGPTNSNQSGPGPGPQKHLTDRVQQILISRVQVRVQVQKFLDLMGSNYGAPRRSCRKYDVQKSKHFEQESIIYPFQRRMSQP
jgi:hypothetical protein